MPSVPVFFENNAVVHHCWTDLDIHLITTVNSTSADRYLMISSPTAAPSQA